MTFNVNSDAFLDVNSLFVTWTVTNTSTDKELIPLTCGAHSLIQCLIITIGGVVVEDCQHYNRLAEMMEIVLPNEKRLNKLDGV